LYPSVGIFFVISIINILNVHLECPNKFPVDVGSILWGTICPRSLAAAHVDGFLTTEHKVDIFSCPGGILDNELSVKSAFLFFPQTLAPLPPWRSSTGRPTWATLSCLLGQCPFSESVSFSLLLLLHATCSRHCNFCSSLMCCDLRHGCVEFCWEEDELQVKSELKRRILCGAARA
jgi:hypothetical protein